MPTDDERREVARRLREEADYPGHAVQYMEQFIGDLRQVLFGDLNPTADYSEIFDRLADLIDPTCDPTGRGIDSIYEWCFERLEGADGAEDELYCSIMRAIEDYRHPERATAHTVRAVDRDALLELTDEMDAYTKCDDERCGREMPPRVIHDFARRIREALEVSQ